MLTTPQAKGLRYPDQNGARARLEEARTCQPSDTAGLGEFFDALFGAAAPEDILRSTPQALATLARNVFAVVGEHKPGGIDVRLLAGPDPRVPELIAVAVNDDRPFLYDSSVLAAAAGGGRIRAAFHPIVTLNGIPTSVIVLVLEPL